MKIIFIKDLKGQGKKGEIKEVSDGYANNFLISKGYAQLATQGVINQVEQEKNSEQRKKDLLKEQAHQLANKMKTITITMRAKAGEGGKLFGAITSKQVADELEKQKILVDKRKILLEEPIRTLGVHLIQIKVHQEITASLSVHVIDLNDV